MIKRGKPRGASRSGSDNTKLHNLRWGGQGLDAKMLPITHKAISLSGRPLPPLREAKTHPIGLDTCDGRMQQVGAEQAPVYIHLPPAREHMRGQG